MIRWAGSDKTISIFLFYNISEVGGRLGVGGWALISAID